MKRAYHKRDWTKVDWSKTNTAIARELGIHQTYVSKKRKNFAPQTSRSVNSVSKNRGRRRIKRDWSQTDWSLSNHEISQQLGLTPEYVAERRRRHAPATIRRPLPSYDSTIWRLTDTEIAQHTRFPLSYVRIVRRQKMGPKPSAKRDWTAIDWNRSTTDLAQDLHVDPAVVSRARRKYAPETLGLSNAARHQQRITGEQAADKIMRFQIPPPDSMQCQVGLAWAETGATYGRTDENQQPR